jgi:hypothetical protein
MASSKQDTTIHQVGSTKYRIYQRSVALHSWFRRELIEKKPKEINGHTGKVAG